MHHSWLHHIVDWMRFIQAMGPWGWGLFIGLYALCCLLFLPASILTIALLALALHGGTFLMFRIAGGFAARARQAVLVLFWPVLLAYVGMTAATFFMRTPVQQAPPVLFVIPLVSLAALLAIFVLARRHDGTRTFAASSLFIVSLMAAAGTTMYPYVLPAYPAGSGGLSIESASASPFALYSALGVTIVGLIAVVVYATLVFRKFTTPLRID